MKKEVSPNNSRDTKNPNRILVGSKEWLEMCLNNPDLASAGARILVGDILETIPQKGDPTKEKKG